MENQPDSMKQLVEEIVAFRDEREWSQFHTPHHLAAAISIEGSELQELFLWKSDEEIDRLIDDPTHSSKVRDEIADIIIYSLLLASTYRINPVAAVREKLATNARRYPVSKSRGNATKYTDL